MFIGRTYAEAEALVVWPLDVKNWLIGKDPDARKYWRQEEKGMIEDEMVGWHHWLNGHESEQTQGDSEGQGSLACWGRKVSGTAQQLNNKNIINVMCLNHPQNCPSVCGRIAFHENSPWSPKGWGLLVNHSIPSVLDIPATYLLFILVLSSRPST